MNLPELRQRVEAEMTLPELRKRVEDGYRRNLELIAQMEALGIEKVVGKWEGVTAPAAPSAETSDVKKPGPHRAKAREPRQKNLRPCRPTPAERVKLGGSMAQFTREAIAEQVGPFSTSDLRDWIAKRHKPENEDKYLAIAVEVSRLRTVGMLDRLPKKSGEPMRYVKLPAFSVDGKPAAKPGSKRSAKELEWQKFRAEIKTPEAA